MRSLVYLCETAEQSSIAYRQLELNIGMRRRGMWTYVALPFKYATTLEDDK